MKKAALNFWKYAEFRDFQDKVKLLAMYVWDNANMVGLYVINVPEIISAIGFQDSAQVFKGLNAICKMYTVTPDKKAIWINGYIKIQELTIMKESLSDHEEVIRQARELEMIFPDRDFSKVFTIRPKRVVAKKEVDPFVPPNKNEVSEYFVSKGYEYMDAVAATEDFFEYYEDENIDWHIGKGRKRSKMLSWQGAVRNWIKNQRNSGELRAKMPSAAAKKSKMEILREANNGMDSSEAHDPEKTEDAESEPIPEAKAIEPKPIPEKSTEPKSEPEKKIEPKLPISSPSIEDDGDDFDFLSDNPAFSE